MNPDPGEGTSNGSVRRLTDGSIVTIKQEIVVKEEPMDDGEVDLSVPVLMGVEAPLADFDMKFESDSEIDDQLDFVIDSNHVKEENENGKKKVKKEKKSSSSNRSIQNAIPAARKRSSDKNRKRATSNGKGKKHAGRKMKTKNKSKSKRSDLKNPTNEKPKEHKCHLCSYAASAEIHLRSHIRIHTGERPFHCDICSKDFSHKHHLNRHKKIHKRELPFGCLKCHQRFAQDFERVNHQNQCQRRHYECFDCKYITDNISYLKIHMRTHSGCKPFECSVCFKSFARKSILTAHSRTHIDELQFDCSKCGQRFGVEAEKQSHEAKCKKRRYECYLCEYDSFFTYSLSNHMRSKHTGERPFICEICRKSFAKKGDLNAHLATHGDRFPFQCSKCRRGFSQEDEKCAHEAICRRRQYQCYLCKSNLYDKTYLEYHIRANHTGERPFQCKVCNICFIQKSNASRHMSRVQGLKK